MRVASTVILLVLLTLIMILLLFHHESIFIIIIIPFWGWSLRAWVGGYYNVKRVWAGGAGGKLRGVGSGRRVHVPAGGHCSTDAGRPQYVYCAQHVQELSRPCICQVMQTYGESESEWKGERGRKWERWSSEDRVSSTQHTKQERNDLWMLHGACVHVSASLRARVCLWRDIVPIG
jgi:hypothetical protein